METEREVRTTFTGRDEGYGALVSRLSRAMDEGQHKVHGLTHRLTEMRKETGLTLAATLGVGFGLGAWIEKAKESQAEFGRTQKGIAGILSSSLKFEKGASEVDRFRRSMELSREITDELDETAARFSMQMDDVGSAYRTTAAAAGSLGLTQKQVMELTIDAAATAKRFGVDGATAATSIARALQTGSVRGFDPFNIALRQSIGNMKHLSEAQRFSHLEHALRGSVEIADQMSMGVGGALGRIQNVVEDLFRDVSRPVFKAVAGDLEGWAKSLKRAKEDGKDLIGQVSGTLVSGMHTVENASAFALRHWKEIAVVWAGMKLQERSESIAKNFGSFASGFARFAGASSDRAGALGQQFGALASSIGPVVAGLGLLKTALDAVIDHVTEAQDEARAANYKAFSAVSGVGILQSASRAGVLTEDQDRRARRTVEEMRKAGVISAKGGFERGGLVEQVRGLDAEQRAELAGKLGVRYSGQGRGQTKPEELADAMIAAIGPMVARLSAVAGGGTVTNDKAIKFAKQVNNFNGGIHITQKFEDTDPDRVFVRFKADLMREVGSRTQALTADPMGD